MWSTQSKGFSIVSKAEVDVFLEFSCFFCDPVDTGNLISASSAFSKSSLDIWKFLVHVLLKPGLENFEHYFASMWNVWNYAVVWTFFGIAFLWDQNENWPFPVHGHCWVFQICLHIECSTFTASSFRIWNSSTGILSPPLALFVVMLPKAHLTSHSILYTLSNIFFTFFFSWECLSFILLESFNYTKVLLWSSYSTLDSKI